MPTVVKVRIVMFRLHDWNVRRIIDHSIKSSCRRTSARGEALNATDRLRHPRGLTAVETTTGFQFPERGPNRKPTGAYPSCASG